MINSTKRQTWKATYSDGTSQRFRQPGYSAAQGQARMWSGSTRQVTSIRLIQSKAQKKADKALCIALYRQLAS